MQCKCITLEQADAAICNQYRYPDMSRYCNEERDAEGRYPCVWDYHYHSPYVTGPYSGACVTKSAFCAREDN